MADPHVGRVPGGDLPLDVRDIGQNRQASFQQAKADHDFEQEEMELKTNTELTRQIHDLLTELDKRTRPAGGPEAPEPRG